MTSSTGNAALHAEQTSTGGKTVDITSGSDSDEDLQSEPGSPIGDNFWDGSPDRDFTRDESADQELSEEASYRETTRGVRSFMGWHQIPEFDSVSSADDNPFADSRVQPTGKVSVKLLVDNWLCRKIEKLNLTITEGYPSRNAETAGLLSDQFVKPPGLSRWYDMHADKKDTDRSTVCSWSPESAKINSVFSRVARHSLLAAPPSWAFSQDIIRRWERAAREQTVMCNQAAGLSRCLTRVQDAISTQLKNLLLDKGQGKSSERTQQAVDELEYLVTFNRSICQAMARTMQDLSEGVFISMANFTLRRRDSYLEYLHAGVKQDTLTALRTAPVHLQSLFPDQLLVKADEEVRRGVLLASLTGNPVVFTLMLSMTSLLINRIGGPVSQLGSRYVNDNRKRKVVASLPLSHRNRPRVLNNVNDNYCVKCVTGLQDCACVSRKISLNHSPVISGSRNLT